MFRWETLWCATSAIDRPLPVSVLSYPYGRFPLKLVMIVIPKLLEKPLSSTIQPVDLKPPHQFQSADLFMIVRGLEVIHVINCYRSSLL